MHEVATGAKTQNGPHAAMTIIGGKRPKADSLTGTGLAR